MDYTDRNYHFYIDEGGIFGDCKVLITDKPMVISDDASNISNYKFGKLPYFSIIRHIQLFRLAFTSSNIVVKTDSKYLLPIQVTENVISPDKF